MPGRKVADSIKLKFATFSAGIPYRLAKPGDNGCSNAQNCASPAALCPVVPIRQSVAPCDTLTLAAIAATDDACVASPNGVATLAIPFIAPTSATPSAAAPTLGLTRIIPAPSPPTPITGMPTFSTARSAAPAIDLAPAFSCFSPQRPLSALTMRQTRRPTPSDRLFDSPPRFPLPSSPCTIEPRD